MNASYLIKPLSVIYYVTAAEKGVKPSWTDLINESVHTSDDIDVGDIDAVSRIFVVVKRGFVNIQYYYIPLTKVEGWDGNVLWLTIPEEKVVTKYEREDLPPDPSRYYVKDYPIYYTGYYPELAIIPPRFTMPSYSYATTILSPTSSGGTLQPAGEDTQPLFICDLCSRSDFRSEDNLANHVNAFH
jgi:hypothetical protein